MRLRQDHRRQGIPVGDPILLWVWGLVLLLLVMGVVVFLLTT